MLGPRLRQGSCRLCLWESNSLWDIFGELAERRNFARKIQACVNISVSKDDGLSSLICPNCIYKIELFYDFQTSCKRSDEIQKRYNEIQDAGRADRDIVEDVLPATALHSAASNSHKDAQGVIETIDIKEEPIDDDDEVTVDGVDYEQFEDAEVEIEEVVAVTEETSEEVIMATEQQKDKDKDKEEEGECGGNGSCLQLTPPRSPSLASEVTYSASEAGGLAERDSPEQQQQQQQQQQQHHHHHHPEEVGFEASSGSLSKESSSTRSGSTSQQQQQEEEENKREEVAQKLPPPAKYPNRCRFCGKWFQKTAVCRVHEMTCGPLHGYTAPQLPESQGTGTGTRCRFCSTLFLSKTGRSVHEYHCLRRERRIQSARLPATAAPLSECTSLRELPAPPKYCNQCRFCRKYFPRVPLRRIHETECGRRLGYVLPPTQPGQPQTAVPSLPLAVPVCETKCSLCGKQLKTVAARYGHEYYCRRNSVLTRHNKAANQCRYCHTHFLSRPQRLSHEISCAKASGWLGGPEASTALQTVGQDVVKCRYCGKGHLKWRSLLTHEFHCRRKAPPRPESDAEVAAQSAEAKADSEVAVSESGRGNKDESASVAESTVSEYKRQGPLNRCSYCHKWLKTKKACKIHESYCSRIIRMNVGGRHKCSYCPRLFLKRNSCVMHERHCFQATNSTGDSETECRAVVSDAAEQKQNQQQLTLTACDTAPQHIGSTDQQEVMPPKVLESERKRKKMDSPLCISVADSTNETEIWTCRYCDRVFKYRECLRTHEVKCSAIAAYQYSTPHHRPPSFFTCPLCRKAFKFRRKLHNHWKVCRARTSVVAEAAELNSDVKPARAGPERSNEIGGGGVIMAPFIGTSSPGEDRQEWRGWPSSHSPTVVDLLTDEDSSFSTVDSPGLSCKLCNKDFCSRVLLELHTLNECVYQRIRNDHAYAQCESPGVDESTLMRMARVELQRLLLCSCCGSIFRDRQALAEHELAERWRHDRTPTEVEDPEQCDREATHLQKRVKLGKVLDKLVLKLENNGQNESSCRGDQLITGDQAVPTTVKKLENADSNQEPSKNFMMQELLLGGDCKIFLQKDDPVKQIKDEVNIQQQERQLESCDGEQGPSKNSLLQKCVRNDTDCNKEQLKDDHDLKVSSFNGRLEQGAQTEVIHPQYQECSSIDHRWQLQNEMPNPTHLLQQQRLEDPNNRQSDQNCSEDNYRGMKYPKITGSYNTVQCQGSKDASLPQGLCNGLGNP